MINMQLAYTVSLAVIASSVSILVWVWFWTRKQDLDNKSVIAVFIGGVAMVIFVLPFQKIIDAWFPGLTFSAILLWVILEEILKFCVVLHAIKFYKIDKTKIIIYMIVAALGFAALENVLFIIGPLIGEDTTRSVITGNLRFIGASLLHVVSSSIVGVGLAYSFYKPVSKRIVITILALALAILFHTVFNLALLSEGSNGNLFGLSITWVSALILVYVVFRKNKKIPKKEIGIFILVVILSISGGVYLNEKLPKYTPEVLTTWQVVLKDVETSRASLIGKGPNLVESISALDSIHIQLESMLMTMEKNGYLSTEQRQFMNNYDEIVQAYKDKLPKYKSEVLASWQEALKEMGDIHTEHILLVATNSNFSKSLMALDSILLQLREIVKTMEENRSLSTDQIDFMSSYNAYVNQFLCIFHNEKEENSTESCYL